MAAALVVGTFATTTTTVTQSAYAYSQKKDNGKGNVNGNGNTVTIEECKNRGSASGFDTTVDQECENLICTHPGENATCVQEGAVATTSTPPVKLTCEQCFTKFLTSAQISALTRGSDDLAFACTIGISTVTTAELQAVIADITGSESIAVQLIQCLLDAGVQFRSDV